MTEDEKTIEPWVQEAIDSCKNDWRCPIQEILVKQDIAKLNGKKKLRNFKTRDLIERTKNYGIKKNPDGTTTHSLSLSIEGSIRNLIGNPKDTWGAMEAVRLYHLGREAWLRGIWNP